MSSKFGLGEAVTYSGAPGIGCVGEVGSDTVRVDFFESAAEPISESNWLPSDNVRRVMLGPQTRVFFKDGRGRWRAGRVVGGGPDVYFVRIPNVRLDLDIEESRLRVRWEKAPRDPLQVLLSGANETPRFRDVREPVRRLLVAERAASGSATGIMSSGVRMHAHQISAALRIIRDPVQRYLLADEVGMGKTIQAGMVIRQVLLDDPGNRRVGVIAPDALMGQWRGELRDKFHLSDFPTQESESPVTILGHSEVSRWIDLRDADLLVVDEAHLLARTAGPAESPYRELAAVAHAVPRALMLTATPFSRGATTHLALLHLLDPELFRWENLPSFELLLEARHALALSVFGLDEEPDVDNPGLLELQFDQLREHLPHDNALQSAIDRALAVYGPDGTPPGDVDEDALFLAVAAVRAHVSETYRLHQRVIRNRRHAIELQKLDDEGLLTPFEFTGRTRPKVARLDQDEIQACALVLSEWASRCSDAILDERLDAAVYGPVVGVLFSRLGGAIDDLCSVLDYRLGGDGTTAKLLPEERAVLDGAPVLSFESATLDRARGAMGGGGLVAVANAIAQRSKAPAKSIVFCGRGSLATQLSQTIPVESGAVKYVYAHIWSQTEEERDQAVENWMKTGGVLVVDDTGDVGRNFQEATLAFHVRLPANPNLLEQRIGRIDRYGDQHAAQQVIMADDDPDGIFSAWLATLVRGYGIFDTSISALQEVVDDLADKAWSSLLIDGIEAMAGAVETTVEALAREKRRINELDALESSYSGHERANDVTRAIAEYEDGAEGIENAFRKLIEGVEGFRFVSRQNPDGSVRFDRDYEEQPLLSERLLGRLMNVESARTGFFDRWRLTPGRALFRRGNPFVDGIEDLLNLDDRGQAVGMWRLNQSWPHDPLAFFGFDFLIEADISPIIDLLEDIAARPVARRRADAAFPPQHKRVWIPISSLKPVTDARFVEYLDQPVVKGRDTNLNIERIPALHSLVGGESYLGSVAQSCFEAARKRVDEVADVVDASKRAVQRVNLETEVLTAQSRARASAGGLVADPAALEAEIALNRAIETGVANPVVRVTAVSVVVVSAQSWADYV